MKKMPRSIRKHIRIRKAQIRRDFSSTKEKEERINKLYLEFPNKNDNKGDIQLSNK